MELIPNTKPARARICLSNGTWREFNIDTVTDPEVLDAMNAEIDERHGPGAAAAIEAAYADGSIFGSGGAGGGGGGGWGSAGGAGGAGGSGGGRGS